MAETTDRDRPGDEEEGEEEIDETGYKSVKDAVLIAIEVSDSMLRKLPASESGKSDQGSATSAALKCAYALMQQRIISHPKDMMGILLFGTEETKFRPEDESAAGQFEYRHCYLLSDLDVPAAADVKRLRAFANDEEESRKLLVPSKEKATMSDVLFCANHVFTTKAPNFSSRRLFLVTDDDNPHANRKELRSFAAVRARDLYDLGVIIELFPISQPDQAFDRSKFYDDIVYQSHPADPEAPAPVATTTKASTSKDGISLLNSLLSNINSKAMPRRALIANLPLELSPDLKISVKGFIILKRQEPARSCYIWMNGENPELVLGSSSRMTEDSARPVEKTELRKAFKFGGETVLFTPEELSELRNFGDPVIRILGFKPLSMLPIWANMKHATFIYPGEEHYVGSTRTFSALQQVLLKQKKMAVAWYIARRNAAPVFAALIPGAEKLGDAGEQTMPPGLWIVTLPTADDIRQNPEIVTHISAPDVLKDKMRPIVQNLQLPKESYDPYKYPNPALQWHYRILQAIALEDDVPEKPEDKTIPRYKKMHQRIKGFTQEWGEELQSQFNQWQMSHSRAPGQAVGIKRSASAAPDAETAKKLKSKSAALNMTDDEMRDYHGRGALGKLSVPVLKDWLGKKKQKTSGAKAELVERVEQTLET
ncbi:MAG: ATP-dependent DNA helicase II subunit 1 [Chrysothrix sp. TS-e1954]|nr:MAG: ATP-dependent DNA helicase II subunit 1 [Chrysothrix sp. TS-e1954]